MSVCVRLRVCFDVPSCPSCLPACVRPCHVRCLKVATWPRGPTHLPSPSTHEKINIDRHERSEQAGRARGPTARRRLASGEAGTGSGGARASNSNPQSAISKPSSKVVFNVLCQMPYSVSIDGIVEKAIFSFSRDGSAWQHQTLTNTLYYLLR
eukprot:scaffold15646_cov112-Isochrysis_galbana.AAC.1